MDISFSIRETLRGVPLIFLILAGCAESPAQAPAEPAAIPVRVTRPQPLAQVSAAHAVGRLEAADEADLAFRSGGVIREIGVDIGDRVRAGQLLATLESVDLAAAVTRARQQTEKTERDLERAHTLTARKLVARAVEDDARTALETARAELAAARFGERYTRIVAGADGVVLARHAEPGETVAGGQPILRVSGEGRHWLLRVEVADRDGVRLGLGAAAEVRVDAFPDSVLPATIRRIGGRANPASGAIAVELDVEDLGQPLKSGLVAEVTIAHEQRGGLAIPVEALIDADATRGEVVVVRDQRGWRQAVTLGAIEGEFVAIRDGLDAETQIVVRGAALVDDGQRVAIVAP